MIICVMKYLNGRSGKHCNSRNLPLFSDANTGYTRVPSYLD